MTTINNNKTNISSNDELKQTQAKDIIIDFDSIIDLPDICKFTSVEFRNNRNIAEDIPQEQLNYIKEHSNIEQIICNCNSTPYIPFVFMLQNVKYIKFNEIMSPWDLEELYKQLEQTSYSHTLDISISYSIDLSRLSKLKHLKLTYYDDDDEYVGPNLLKKEDFIDDDFHASKSNLKSLSVRFIDVGSHTKFRMKNEFNNMFRGTKCVVEVK